MDAKTKAAGAALGVAAAAAGGGLLYAANDATTPEDMLRELTVATAGPAAGYSREQFPLWGVVEGRCDTREKVLERDGKNVVQDTECRAVAGSWVSPYDGKKVDDALGLDIDHMVPLKNAWVSGAAGWDLERRKQFANDLVHPQLFAVTAAANRAKGAKGPEAWKPPSEAFWCTYATDWISVKRTYQLTVTEAEKNALADMLTHC
jgi:hypothetical protein